MSSRMAVIQQLRQMWFDFLAEHSHALRNQDRGAPRVTERSGREMEIPTRPAAGTTWDPEPRAPRPASDPGAAASENSRDEAMEAECRRWLRALGMESVCDRVEVVWNPRLRSTAGYALYPAWRIELNPRLREFDGQLERTLKHELAHLIAYHRAGRKRIEPHGEQWKQACADLGIPDESAHHHLPLPRRHVRRGLTYACPGCGLTVRRVKKFRRYTACLSCCRTHAGGKYDPRFQFRLVATAPPDDAPPAGGAK